MCPWMTERDIRGMSKFIEKMLKKLRLSKEDEDKLLGLDRPDRRWTW